LEHVEQSLANAGAVMILLWIFAFRSPRHLPEIEEDFERVVSYAKRICVLPFHLFSALPGGTLVIHASKDPF